MAAVYAAWAHWVVARYSYRSAWGVYCCASMPKGVLFRLITLTFNFQYPDWYVTLFLGTFGSSGMDGARALPLMIFAWKRVRYMCLLLINLDDNPWKMWALFTNSLHVCLDLNAALSISMIGSASIDDVITYVACDTFQFGMRVGLLGRYGMKSCPKLFKFILLKQLSNIPCPLPKQAENLGHKTAMRIMQALMTVLEGETLTVNLAYIALYALQWGVIMDSEFAWAMIPLKTYLIVVIFVVIDLVQDIMAGKVGDKFCNWSYIYSSEGWQHKKNNLYVFIVFFCWGVSWRCDARSPAVLSKLVQSKRSNMPAMYATVPSPGAMAHL